MIRSAPSIAKTASPLLAIRSSVSSKTCMTTSEVDPVATVFPAPDVFASFVMYRHHETDPAAVDQDLEVFWSDTLASWLIR
jgi:hypothetical protein